MRSTYQIRMKRKEIRCTTPSLLSRASTSSSSSVSNSCRNLIIYLSIDVSDKFFQLDCPDHCDRRRCITNQEQDYSLLHHQLPSPGWLGGLPPVPGALLHLLRRPPLPGGCLHPQGQTEGQHLWIQTLLVWLQDRKLV